MRSIVRVTTLILFISWVLSRCASASDAFSYRMTSGPSYSGIPIAVDLNVLLSPVDEPVRIPLPNGNSYLAERVSLDMRGTREFTWRGKIYAEDWNGDVIFAASGDAIAGILYTPSGRYSINPTESGSVLVGAAEEKSKFKPPCVAIRPDLAKLEQTGPPSQANSAPRDSGAFVDVMILYTSAALAVVGDADAMVAHAQVAVAVTNAAFENSQITPRIRLVHIRKLDGYSEPATTTDSGSYFLNFLRQNAAVRALRNSYGADLVHLVVASENVCGIGYLMSAVDPNFEGFGFSVSGVSCFTGFDKQVFAHELGHNFGCEHNPEASNNSPAQASFPYSFGHYRQDGEYSSLFGTVMAYYSVDNGHPPFFSNPSVHFLGRPTGIPDKRDNHRAINNTADLVANFRVGSSTSVAFPGFRFRVLITTPGGSINGRLEKACVPETICFSGAIPGRPELFIRIVGPKPNGFLWPTIVKFNTSKVDVWIEQISTGKVRHYSIEAVGPDDSELKGLIDKEGFLP